MKLKFRKAVTPAKKAPIIIDLDAFPEVIEEEEEAPRRGRPRKSEEQKAADRAERLEYTLSFDMSRSRVGVPFDLTTSTGFRRAWNESCARPDLYFAGGKHCDACPHYRECWYAGKRLKDADQYDEDYPEKEEVEVEVIRPGKKTKKKILRIGRKALPKLKKEFPKLRFRKRT